MIDERQRFERAFELFEMPEPALERLVLRRERKSRNQRVAALAIAVGIVAAGFAILVRGWFVEPRPADEPVPRPSPTSRFESPFHGYSIEVPEEWSVTAATAAWTWGEPRRADFVNASWSTGTVGYSFNLGIASVEIPAGTSAEEWQRIGEEGFAEVKRGTCPGDPPTIEPIRLDSIDGRLAVGCDDDLFATFVVQGRGYVLATSGPARAHPDVLDPLLDSIEFHPELAVAPPPSASEWRGTWPQETRAAAEAEQALADSTAPEARWQVDWNQEGLVARRYLQEVLGWEVLDIGVSYRPSDAEQAWEAEVVEWYFIRCEPGATNPLYPDDPRAGTCAPTIDDTRYQQVVVRTEQLVQPGRGGIWLITGWEQVQAYTQDVPSTQRAILELAQGFLDARVAGEGAEASLADRDAEFPLLYATRDGEPYAGAEIVRVDGPDWPFADTRVVVELQTAGGQVVVRQELWLDVGGRELRISFAFVTRQDGEVVTSAFG